MELHIVENGGCFSVTLVSNLSKKQDTFNNLKEALDYAYFISRATYILELHISKK